MTINTNSNTAAADASVLAAQHELEAATARLAQAQERASFENTFTEAGTVFTVVARVPDFSAPFPGYTKGSRLVAIFTTQEAADRYIAGTPNPPSEDLLVEERSLRA